MYVWTRLYRQELAENDTFKKNDAMIVLFGAGVLFSTFIYGNIPSMALAFTALWLQLQWQREEGHPAWKLLLSAMCITLAVLLKSFALILLVAQYILQYFILALPYGAAGLNEMAAALKTRILRLRSRPSKTAKAG